MKQEDGETVDQFVVKLKNQAKTVVLAIASPSRFVTRLLTSADHHGSGKGC
jgi:hypothetical protein